MHPQLPHFYSIVGRRIKNENIKCFELCCLGPRFSPSLSPKSVAALLHFLLLWLQSLWQLFLTSCWCGFFFITFRREMGGVAPGSVIFQCWYHSTNAQMIKPRDSWAFHGRNKGYGVSNISSPIPTLERKDTLLSFPNHTFFPPIEGLICPKDQGAQFLADRSPEEDQSTSSSKQSLGQGHRILILLTYPSFLGDGKAKWFARMQCSHFMESFSLEIIKSLMIHSILQGAF